MTEYENFIDQKLHAGSDSGFEPLFLSDKMFDFQKFLAEWAIRKGRGAIFADCGLGKTLIQLVWAKNVMEQTGKSVLILTPLAVSQQTVSEGVKFDIECNRSMDGKPRGITITNYEKLHMFDSADYSGVVCDECLVGDTPVDTKNGTKRIKDVKTGDFVWSANGLSKVKSKKKRYCKTLVLTTIQGRSIISSKRHPFFTLRGWVPASKLKEDDYVITTRAAMSMLREEFTETVAPLLQPSLRTEERCKVPACGSMPMVREGISTAIISREQKEVLQSVLFSELEDETTRNSSPCSHERGARENRSESFGLVEGGQRGSSEANGTDTESVPNKQPRSKKENIKTPERNRTQAAHTGRQRKADANTPEESVGRTGEGMDRRVRSITENEGARLSDTLQDRHRQSAENDCSRSRRVQSCGRSSKSTGRKKGCTIEAFRVDSVTIYEQSSSIFNRYRDESGRVALYDLEIEDHPSFSVHGMLVHNSSILKSYDGVRRGQITDFMRKMPYRLLATATAAPNDYTELGTSSEALGYLGHMDMLNRFFKNNRGNIATRRMYGEAPEWSFKGHAEMPFWRWVTSWARACRTPSDLGFEDNDFILPPLKEVQHPVEARSLAEGMLFNLPASTMFEQRDEKRRTIGERCEMAADIVNTNEQAIVWCHLNDEGDALEKAIPGSVQISGKDSDDRKEDKFMSFLNKDARVLVTKPKIGAWGLNFQQCNHIVYFPSHSFEQYYQAVRRCWRFGQKREVTVDIVLTEGERLIMDNLSQKATAAQNMFTSLVQEMNHSISLSSQRTFTKTEELPKWL